MRGIRSSGVKPLAPVPAPDVSAGAAPAGVASKGIQPMPLKYSSAQAWALRASLAQRVGAWTVREFVRVDNLADRGYVGSVIVNEGNRRFFEPAPGRSWLAGVNAVMSF